MQIVIDISEEEYINIKNAINSLIKNGIERASMSKVCLAILDGTPLPKGHGNLIDIKDLYEHLNKERDDNFVLKADAIVSKIKPIIEADKTESEGICQS